MSAPNEKGFLADAEPERAATEIAKTLHKTPALLTTWTCCGKSHCRCRQGHLHGPYHVLHWRDGTIQRRRYVRGVDVPAVRAILETRRRERADERLAHALSLCWWRQLAQLVEDVEVSLRGEKEGL